VGESFVLDDQDEDEIEEFEEEDHSTQGKPARNAADEDCTAPHQKKAKN